MKDFAFIPTKEQTEDSNVFKFMKKHNIDSFDQLCNKSIANLDWYWDAVNDDIGIVWDKKYTMVSDFSGGKPWPKWFVDGKTNIINSTITKFAKMSSDKFAYHFVSEDGKSNSTTYGQLEALTNKLANGLKSLGVKKGDVVAIYMPMILESIVAILACAKIGAIQTTIFSGYSSDALKIRLQDSNARLLIISDGFTRRGKQISQKHASLEATSQTSVEKIIVVPYKGVDKHNFSESVIDYSSLVENQALDCRTEVMDSEDPLFILYTSGTTGKPKGAIHTHGSYSVYAGHQSAYLIDLKHDDVLLWPADIGWITGLAWNVYGLLEIGASAIIYDGAIDWPNPLRLWELVQKFHVTIFGTSPTAVRMYENHGIDPRKHYELDSIRLIPTTGEPIDQESWWWLFEKIGNKKIPIMNLAGGTEIGGAMLSVFPGMRLKPTTVGKPCPGFELDVVDENKKPVRNQKGFLVVRSPWPAMTRGLLNDNERYIATYWSKYGDVWFHGDYALIDDDGLWYMHGRVDDVINVSGHRLSTVEIEQTVLLHPEIAAAAAISIPDKITGEAIAIFVVLKEILKNDAIKDDVASFVTQKIGKLARPKYVNIISDMPKTRTGKIMRRLLKKRLLGEDLGDLTSLENPQVLDEISAL